MALMAILKTEMNVLGAQEAKSRGLIKLVFQCVILVMRLAHPQSFPTGYPF